MTVARLRLIGLASLVLGCLSFVSAAFGALVAIPISLYLTASIWLGRQAIRWHDDLVFWLSMVATTVLSTVVYGMLCGAVPSTGFTTKACATFGLTRILELHAYFLAFPALLVWCGFRLWLWWNLRRH